MGETCNLSTALSIFSDNLPDVRKACVENIRAIVAEHQPAKEMQDDDEWTVENIHQHANHLVIADKTKHYVQTIRRIDGRNRQFSKGKITDEDIAMAREYPITDLWQELVNTPIRGGMAKCCFHEDSTASLSLRRHNRYHCFGCGEKGDSIDLYMKLNNVNFIEAVKKLNTACA